MMDIFKEIMKNDKITKDRIEKHRKCDQRPIVEDYTKAGLEALGDEAKARGRETGSQSPIPGAAYYGAGLAIQSKPVVTFMADSVMDFQDEQNRSAHINSEKRPETPTLGDRPSPNF